MLLKVWAVRGGILGAPDGFTGFILSMLMTHFVTTGGKLNPLMDARQLVKGSAHAAFRPKRLCRWVLCGRSEQFDTVESARSRLYFLGHAGT